MKLDNNTRYHTRTLRSIMIAVYRATERDLNKPLPQWKRLRVKIAYRRRQRSYVPVDGGGYESHLKEREPEKGHSYSGHAYYHGSYSHLSVPKGELSVALFVKLWRHELWHLYGVRHEDMPPSVLWVRDGPDPWADVIARRFLPTITELPEPAVDKTEEKLQAIDTAIARAEERLIAWRRKYNRASTGIDSTEREIRRLRHRRARLLKEKTERAAALPKPSGDRT